MTGVHRPLALKIREASLGLYYWDLTSTAEGAGDVRINGSDHPYPTREAALQAGLACMKALDTPTSA